MKKINGIILAMLGVLLVIILINMIISNKKLNNINNTNIKVSYNLMELRKYNIDKIINTIDTVVDNTEPTETQKELIDKWDKTFIVNNDTLIISYNIKTREVIDYFLINYSEIDNNDYLRKLNIKKNSYIFDIENVICLNNKDYKTGVIIKEKEFYNYRKNKKEKLKNDSIKKEEIKQVKIKKEKEHKKFLKTKAGRYYTFCHKNGAIVSKEDCIEASKNKIWIGMNIWLLIARRGNPNHINESDYGYGIQRQYVWNDWNPSYFYDDNNDNKIDSYN